MLIALEKEESGWGYPKLTVDTLTTGMFDKSANY